MTTNNVTASAENLKGSEKDTKRQAEDVTSNPKKKFYSLCGLAGILVVAYLFHFPTKVCINTSVFYTTIQIIQNIKISKLK